MRPNSKPGLWKCDPQKHLLISTVICSLLCFKALTPAPAAAEPGQLTTGDLLTAFSAYHKRLALINGSRSWRLGVRAHVTVDDLSDAILLRANGRLHNETFTVFPDFPTISISTRTVAVPMFAHHAYRGTYKWMLAGDDDTIFSIPAVLRLLQSLPVQHTEPVALSDFLTECKLVDDKRVYIVGIPRDPRCIPCESTAAASSDFCPCRLPANWTTQPSSHIPQGIPCPREGRVGFYGGTGVILSHGLMEHIFSNLLSKTLQSEDSPGKPSMGFLGILFSDYSINSDPKLSEALRKFAVGFNVPPPSLTANLPATDVLPGGGVKTKHLFGMYCTFNDDRGPMELLQYHKDKARNTPEEFRSCLSTHMRYRIPKGMTESDYMMLFNEMGDLMAKNT